MGNIPKHLSLKSVFVFLLVKLQNCEFLAMFESQLTNHYSHTDVEKYVCLAFT